jgi:MoaA/NifB/PqqE/SkfB family radical SAM enzyme
MTAEELKISLRQEYDLITFLDLADLRQKHRAVFDVFKKHRRESFDDNQRLVFYSQFEPEQSFLDHIQRAAAKIDISNFFILVICPFDIRLGLENSNKKFGYDDSVIQSMIRPLEGTNPFGIANFVVSESICPLPFSQCEIGSAGDVRPCCKFDGMLGNTSDLLLQEIFHGQYANDVRAKMILGQKPQECSVCWKSEAAGTTSFRKHMLTKYENMLDQHWLDDVQIRDVTWAPSSLCNFSCRICHPAVSTSIAVEEIKFAGDDEYKKLIKKHIKIRTDPEKSKSTIGALERLSDLEYLHILGGEPFLWPDFDHLIDRMILAGKAREISLEFNTNCSVFPETKMNRVIQNFKSVELLLSVDNIGPRFEIERGGKWPEILENIKNFISLRSQTVKVKLAVTVNLQNLLYLSEVIDFAESLNVEILWWYLEDPEYLCIDRATDQVKEIIFSKYQSHSNKELQKIAKRVKDSAGSNGQDFINYIRKIDQRRNQSFSETHKEIYQFMGGCNFLETLL